jgi:pimeloyl-ACP methyl ester carboxylesterase
MPRRLSPALLARIGSVLLVLSLLSGLFAALTLAHGQPADPEPFSIEGYWRGAYVRDGATQPVTGTVVVANDTPRVTLTNEEWTYFGTRRAVPMTQNNDGRLSFETHYGTAQVDVDSTYRELVGTVGEHEPAIEIHLKKHPPPPPAPSPQTADVAFGSGGTTLRGTVVTPDTPGPHPALVYVPGRGCADRGGGLRRLRWLAERGIAGLAYDNRGAGASDGSCSTTTIETESRDIRAALQVLAGRDDIDADRIGLWGNSAAGWYIPHAVTRSTVDVAFVVEKVGPSTSVEAQQNDNARLIAEEMGLAPADSAKMLRYVDLMFAADRPNDAVFAEMQALLAHGDSTGWADQFLVRDPSIGDVPATAAGLDSLWARRYDYDPAGDLRRMDMPFLAFYGAEDRIVPATENAPRMRRLLAGNENAGVVVVPKTGHGLGQGSEMRTLSTPDGRYDTHYWKFYRVAPDYLAPLLRFLDHHALRAGAPR